MAIWSWITWELLIFRSYVSLPKVRQIRTGYWWVRTFKLLGEGSRSSLTQKTKSQSQDLSTPCKMIKSVDSWTILPSASDIFSPVDMIYCHVCSNKSKLPQALFNPVLIGGFNPEETEKTLGIIQIGLKSPLFSILIHIYIYKINLYVYMYIYIYIYNNMYVYMYMNPYIRIYNYIYIHLHIYRCTYV